MTWLWWAPLLAAVIHITEEFVYPGGFAEWDRAYRPQIRGSITTRLHVVVNALLLAACVTVGLAGMARGEGGLGVARIRTVVPPEYAVAAWLTLSALLFSNTVFHLLGTVQTRRLSPGVRSGLLLYVPMAGYGYGHFLQTGQASVATAVVAALLGGSYHLWASMMHAARVRTV